MARQPEDGPRMPAAPRDAQPALSHRVRRRLALLVLLVGLPVYIVAAVTLVERFERPGILVELLIYVGLGVIWALPLRFIFRGVGRSEAEADGPRR